MAQKTTVQLVDDLDGTEIAHGKGETVTFGLDGITYEIDLTDKNAQAFRDSFGKYLDVSRKMPGGRSGTRRTRTKSDTDPAAVRAWARSHNVDVNERGRISQAVVDQFKAAGN